MLNSDRHDTYPKTMSAIKDYVAHARHKMDPVDIGEMSYPMEEDCFGDWEDIYAAGYPKGKGRGRTKAKARAARAFGGAPAKVSPGRLGVTAMPATSYVGAKRHIC